MEMADAMEVGMIMLGIMQKQREEFIQTQNMLMLPLIKHVKSQAQQDFTKILESLLYKQQSQLLKLHFKKALWELQLLLEAG